MPNWGNFGAGLMQGFNQSFWPQIQNKEKREAVKKQLKLYDLQIKKAELAEKERGAAQEFNRALMSQQMESGADYPVNKLMQSSSMNPESRLMSSYGRLDPDLQFKIMSAGGPQGLMDPIGTEARKAGAIAQAKLPSEIELARSKMKPVATPAAVRTFESQVYGKEVPELRGTPEYIQKVIEFKKYGRPETKIDVTTDETLVRDLINQGLNTRRIVRMTDEISSMVGKDATLIGATGAAQRFIDSVSSQLKGVANKFTRGQAVVKGRIVSENVLLNPDTYDWSEFKEGATASAEIKSSLVKLAYIVARQQDPEGRLSDYDIKNALSQIGAKSGSPEQLKTVLKSIKRRSMQEYNDFAVQMGKPYIESIVKHKKTGKTGIRFSDGTIQPLEY